MADLPSGTVTFLFTDIEGSTALWERNQAAMQGAVERHLDLVGGAVNVHHGTLYKTIGDGTQSAFSTPGAALAAALDAQHAVLSEPWTDPPGPLRIRMALHAGVAHPTGGDYLAAPLNRLSRLLGIARGGQILLTEAVAQLAQDDLPADASLQDVGVVELRDLERDERVFALAHPDLPSEIALPMSQDQALRHFPSSLTPFLGRAGDVAAVVALLETPGVRLVTLTGPGGIGKTRLAQEVGERLAPSFAAGAVFVDLAPLRDPALVLPTIATALGLREVAGSALDEVIQGYLTERNILVLLDNFEHLLDAAPVVTQLLVGSSVKVLVTSRASLRLRGEHEHPVPPLRLPDADQMEDLATLAANEAVAFFIARARAIRPDFRLTAENALVVTEICARLDGLPLAIELAAARIRVLPLPALLARLEKRLPLLVGGPRDAPQRQRTLRDTIAWSHDLLTPGEQQLFQALGVFVDGWTFEAAEAVVNVAGDVDVLEGLASLTEKSLVQLDERGPESRYRMLETIREFAMERLMAGPDAESVHRGLLTYLLQLADENDLDASGSVFEVRLARLGADEANFRAALEWGIDHDPEMALAVNARLGLFWFAQGRLTTGLELHERIMATGAGPLAPERALSLASTAWLAINLGDFARAKPMADGAFALAERLGETRHAAYARYCQGSIAVVRGDAERATALLQDARTRYEALGDLPGVLACLNELGVHAMYQGDAAGAVAFFDRCLALADVLQDLRLQSSALANLASAHRYLGHHAMAQDLSTHALALAKQVGTLYWQAVSLGLLGQLALDRGEIAPATTLIRESTGLWWELGDRRNVAAVLESAGAAMVAGNRAESAARLFGTVEALREAIASPMGVLDRADYERDLAAVREALDEATFTQAWVEGRRIPLATAVAEAVEVMRTIGGDQCAASAITSSEVKRNTIGC
jgi:predicted ATPase/class 3 adenylate cyclase